MMITEDGEKALMAVIREEIRRVNAADDGRVTQFGDLEDMVTGVVNRLGDTLMQEVAKAQEKRSPPQKKTARNVTNSGNS